MQVNSNGNGSWIDNSQEITVEAQETVTFPNNKEPKTSKLAIPNALGRETTWKMSPFDVCIVGLDIQVDMDHHLWDPRALEEPSQAMISSILELGHPIQAITVEKDGKGVDAKYFVVEGRHRTRATRAACLIARSKGDPEPYLRVQLAEAHLDEVALDLIQNAANCQRRDDSLVVKASKAARLLTRGHSKKAVASMCEIEPATLVMWLKINKLTDEVKAAIDANKIRPYAAAKLADLPKELQIRTLKELIRDGTLQELSKDPLVPSDPLVKDLGAEVAQTEAFPTITTTNESDLPLAETPLGALEPKTKAPSPSPSKKEAKTVKGKKPKGATAKEVQKAINKTTNKEEKYMPAPSKWHARHIVQGKIEHSLPSKFIQGAKWALGLLSIDDVDINVLEELANLSEKEEE